LLVMYQPAYPHALAASSSPAFSRFISETTTGIPTLFPEDA
jgi:hypothetical protein